MDVLTTQHRHHSLNHLHQIFQLRAKTAKTKMENRSNLSTSIVNQRLSVSGVDEDEESMDLMRFQQAYNLCSKVISVMNECYDRLITQTGV